MVAIIISNLVLNLGEWRRRSEVEPCALGPALRRTRVDPRRLIVVYFDPRQFWLAPQCSDSYSVPIKSSLQSSLLSLLPCLLVSRSRTQGDDDIQDFLSSFWPLFHHPCISTQPYFQQHNITTIAMDGGNELGASLLSFLIIHQEQNCISQPLSRSKCSFGAVVQIGLRQRSSGAHIPSTCISRGSIEEPARAECYLWFFSTYVPDQIIYKVRLLLAA